MPFVQRFVEPRALSRTALFDDDGKAKVTDGELEAVTNNTLCNALRQLASLVLVANDIFEELGGELKKINEKSEKIKVRINVLEGKVDQYDPKAVTVRGGYFYFACCNEGVAMGWAGRIIGLFIYSIYYAVGVVPGNKCVVPDVPGNKCVVPDVDRAFKFFLAQLEVYLFVVVSGWYSILDIQTLITISIGTGVAFIIRNSVPEELKNRLCKDEIIQSLGIRLALHNDEFQFKVETQKPDTLTKRTLLSVITKLFDPLGWLAPVIIKTKILMQA